MNDKKSKNNTELTPATLENMPVSQKIMAYEQILNEQTTFTKKLQEIKREGDEVLASAGQQFSEFIQRSNICVPKKRIVDPTISVFAQRIGNNITNIIANGSTGEVTLEQYLGEESYAKLKKIADEYSIQGYGSKNADEKESEKVWQQYTKIRKEYQDVRESLDTANRRMDQTNQYVSYVQKLAEVASKTRRLMQ